MRLSTATIVGCVAAAQAWENTSPFVMFSTSQETKSLQEASKDQLQAISTVTSTLNSFLSSCPSDIYYFIHQPKLSPLDFHSDTMPHLFRESKAFTINSRYCISDVVRTEAPVTNILSEMTLDLEKSCDKLMIKDWGFESVASNNVRWNVEEGVKEGYKTAYWVSFPSNLPEAKGDRESKIREHDSQIDAMLRHTLVKGLDYTVVYLSTPLNGTIKEEATLYEPEFETQAHIDLKRSIQARVPPKTIETDQRPLFEKYQFFTPGIFMGLITGIIMFMILSVGITAVSSLQVSYGAFDKENGPAAQKNK